MSQISTAVALRDLNCASIDTVSDRILLQKKIYLAQNAGLPLGYGYSWYIHGPYSPDLTAVAYQVIPEGIDSIKEYKLEGEYAEIVKNVNLLEDQNLIKENKLNTVSWYELIASIAYWFDRGYNDKNKIIEKIKETKPQFSENQTGSAYETYNKFIQVRIKE